MNHSHHEHHEKHGGHVHHHTGHSDRWHHGHDAHDSHAGHSVGMFRNRFWLSLLLTIPTVLYSHAVMDLLNFQMPAFPGSRWLPVILGTIVFFYGGLVFLKSAKGELDTRQPGMMTLISLAITVAFVYSLAVSLGLIDGMDLWWELATLITIMLLGHWLEMSSIDSAQGALKELAKLLPDKAELVTTEGSQTVAIAELRVDDTILIRPGTSVPADGTVIKGTSDVNESMLTGESRAIKKTTSDHVIAGTINGSGSLTVKVTKVGDDTTLAGIVKLVQDAQNTKSKTQVLADRAAFYLTFVALGAALLTAIGWTLLSDQPAAFTLERVVTVLVIACPHALGLAIPLVTAISTTKAAQSGLLVRDRKALETARNIDIVLFDKTGTLTKGEQGVVQIVATDSDNDELLGLAASIENESEHPIARAIVRYASSRKLKIKPAQDFSALAGRGATATVGDRTIHVGGPQLLKELGVKLPGKLEMATKEAGSDGKTVVYVIEDKDVRGAIMLADTIREDSREAVSALQDNGSRVAMLTGDSHDVAAWVARELNIDEYFAEVLPEHKAAVVKNLQKSGNRVAMVGDGVNDAPALAQANIGIAIGAGTDVAIESAGIVLASNDPRGVTKIVRLSKATYRKMLQNLAWATGYNILAIPLAAGVLYGYGIVLAPAVGAVLMSLSTIIVALNAQLLRKTHI